MYCIATSPLLTSRQGRPQVDRRSLDQEVRRRRHQGQGQQNLVQICQNLPRHRRSEKHMCSLLSLYILG